jgi:hypothetical protein
MACRFRVDVVTRAVPSTRREWKLISGVVLVARAAVGCHVGINERSIVTTTEEESVVDGSWTDIEREIGEWLGVLGDCTPAELGKHLGMSESATASLICVLAAEGKLRISRVCAVARAGQAAA